MNEGACTGMEKKRMYSICETFSKKNRLDFAINDED